MSIPDGSLVDRQRRHHDRSSSVIFEKGGTDGQVPGGRVPSRSGTSMPLSTRRVRGVASAIGFRREPAT